MKFARSLAENMSAQKKKKDLPIQQIPAIPTQVGTRGAGGRDKGGGSGGEKEGREIQKETALHA